MAEAGIAAIALAGTATEQEWKMTDNIVINHGEYLRTDGTAGSLADVALNYSPVPEPAFPPGGPRGLWQEMWDSPADDRAFPLPVVFAHDGEDDPAERGDFPTRAFARSPQAGFAGEEVPGDGAIHALPGPPHDVPPPADHWTWP
jgi:hypothetical protein